VRNLLRREGVHEVNEVEFLATFGKEIVSIATIIVVYFLFIKPKDMQIEKKDEQIEELVETNRFIVSENSAQLGKISHTMDKISSEIGNLSENQKKLNDGQDDLWKEIVRLKGDR